MKKLTLNVDELRVDSFDAGASGAGLGTVRGLQMMTYTNIADGHCNTDVSCDGSCDLSCDGTCFNTCDTCPAQTC